MSEEKVLDLEKLKEPFAPGQVEFRLSQCGKNKGGNIWAQCLAYITSRAVLDRLDEVCGPQGWRVRYTFHPGAGFICTLGILVDGQWIEKEDGAECTHIEPFKGGISSALKRAGSAWGIGRYLYDLESGWAEIVEKGTRGAIYGKTKDGDVFYWLPPQLPDWALPGKQEAETLKRIESAVEDIAAARVDQAIAAKKASASAATSRKGTASKLPSKGDMVAACVNEPDIRHVAKDPEGFPVGRFPDSMDLDMDNVFRK